jgi:hypothetical protein
VSSKNKGSQESHSAAYGVSAATTDGSAAGSTDNNSINDAAICAFLADLTSNTKSQVLNQDMDYIDPDDLEEIDLKWPMAMLTIRARRFLKRT